MIDLSDAASVSPNAMNTEKARASQENPQEQKKFDWPLSITVKTCDLGDVNAIYWYWKVPWWYW